MTLYEESKVWCKDYAKDHKLKYRAQLEDRVHKYFYSLKEAQAFFDSRFKDHKAIIAPKPSKDFIDLEVSYVKI